MICGPLALTDEGRFAHSMGVRRAWCHRLLPGAAALFVPFPFAVDDHQTTNARFLVQHGAGWLVQQAELTAQALAARLQSLDRSQLLACAQKAHEQKKTNATREVVMA